MSQQTCLSFSLLIRAVNHSHGPGTQSSVSSVHCSLILFQLCFYENKKKVIKSNNTANNVESAQWYPLLDCCHSGPICLVECGVRVFRESPVQFSSATLQPGPRLSSHAQITLISTPLKDMWTHTPYFWSLLGDFLQ